MQAGHGHFLCANGA
ncbi:hypothetical protein [Novosphingobium sp. PY1]